MPVLYNLYFILLYGNQVIGMCKYFYMTITSEKARSFDVKLTPC